MCRFKSGIIFKNRVVLAPEGNESHTDLLDSLGVKDDSVCVGFVRVELIPPDGNKAKPIGEWKFNVDQDYRPDWFDLDREKYENEFRDKVADYMKDKLCVICGYNWIPIKDGSVTHYVMDGFMDKTTFGENNDYRESKIRKQLLESQLLEDLKYEFGDRLVPHNLNLVSMDGFHDYGVVEDELSIMNIEFLMKFGEKIPPLEVYYWLATPNQTSTRGDSCYVQYVGDSGRVDYRGCRWDDLAARPFFTLLS